MRLRRLTSVVKKKMHPLILTLAASAALMVAAEAQSFPPARSPQPTGRWWVYLTSDDRTAAEIASVRTETADQLSSESLQRRRRFLTGTPPVRGCDLPPAPARLQALERAGCEVVHSARYINAVSVRAGKPELERVRALPFVERIEPVYAFPASKEDVQGGLQSAPHVHGVLRCRWKVAEVFIFRGGEATMTIPAKMGIPP